MKRRFQIDEAAEQELAEAFDHYETERSGLGATLLAHVHQALDRLREWPEACSPIAGTKRHVIRSIPVPPLPYQIVFLDHPSELVVIAIAHDRRRPGYWRRRLRGR